MKSHGSMERVKDATQRILSSRQAIGVVLVVGALLLAALAPATRAQQGSSVSPKPGYGGSIAVANGEPDCLDPQKTALAASDTIAGEVVDSLISIDDAGRFRPELALSWMVSHGGKLLTFHLRSGVHFSNGDRFDAEAVKFSFERALNPATKSPVSASDLAAVRSIEAPNASTVRLVLKTPSRPLMTDLASSYLGILDPRATRRQGSDTCQNPIGTGPFKVSAVGPGYSSVALVRNRYHTWETPAAHNRGQAYLARLVFETVTNDATMVSELLTGEVDVSTVAGTQLSRVKGNKTIVLHSIPQQGELFLGFNFANPLFAKRAVRRAVGEVVKRRDLVTAALGGLGQPVYSALPPTVHYGFATRTARRGVPRYDPAAARRVFAVNHATGPYTLLVPQLPQATTSAEVIQAELARAGMAVKIVAEPVPAYFSQAAGGKFDMDLFRWTYNDPDIPYLLFHSSQGKGAGLNFTQYSSASLDHLLVRGREAISGKKARAIYDQIQQFIARQSLIISLALSTQPIGVRSRVRGWHYDKPANAILYQDLYVTGR